MDVKTAIELLKNYGGCMVTDHKGVIRLNTDSLIKLLNKQEEYAELGKLAIEISNKDFECNRIFDDNCFPGNCNWYLFCQKRSKMV